MGFRGYAERLCENGHYDQVPTGQAAIEQEVSDTCTFCGKPIAQTHVVDTTNGYNENYPSTCNAPKQEIGYDDNWQTDHHGNRYAVKVPRYRPKRHWVSTRY